MLKFLFGLALIFVGFCGVLFVEPVWGVYLFAALSHIRLDQLGDSITLPERVPIVIGVTTLIMYVLSRAYTEKFRRWPAEVWLFGLMVVGLALSSMQARFDRAAAWEMTYAYFENWVFFVLLIQTLDTRKRLDGFYWTLILSAAWLVFCAWSLRGTTGPRFTNYGGGNVSDSNDYAAALVMLFPFVFQRTFSSRRVIAVAAGVLCFGVFMAAIIADSRGAFLGFLVLAVIIILCFKEHRVRNLVMLATVAVLVFSFAKSGQIERLQSIVGNATGTARDNSSELRLQFWGLALRLFEQHPLLGIGPRNFWYYSGYMLEGRPYGVPGHVTHSLWMELLSSGGLMVMVPFVLMLWRFGRSSWRLGRMYARAGRRDIALYIYTPMFAMGGFLVAASFIDRMVYEPIYWCIALGVAHRYLWGPGGIEAAVGQQDEASGAERPGRGRKKTRPVLKGRPMPAGRRVPGSRPIPGRST